MWPGFWLALALAALLNLDRQACGQLALSRPLVSAGLVGLVAGRPELGLQLGLWTELLWLAKPPLGGDIAPNGGLAASAAVLGCLVASPQGADGGRLTALALLAFALTPPLARAMTAIEILTRRRASHKAGDMACAVAGGSPPSALALQLASLSATLGLGIVFLSASTAAVGAALALCAHHLPAQAWGPLAKLARLAPLIGVAAMTEQLDWRRLAVLAALTASATALLLAG